MFDYFPAVGGNSLAAGFIIIIIIMGDIINTQIIPLSQIVGNRGQLKGLPKNPRVIKDDKFAKLVASIREQPDMLYLRELLVYPFKDKYIVIGGNMRHKAMKELGVADAPCKVIPAGTPVDKLCQILLKDNSSYGEWDTQALAFDFDEGLSLIADLTLQMGVTRNKSPKKRKAGMWVKTEGLNVGVILRRGSIFTLRWKHHFMPVSMSVQKDTCCLK